MAAEVIGTKGLDFIEYHQLLKISLPSKKIDNREEKKVDKSDKPRQDGLPMWLSWSRRITVFKLYLLLSQELKRFSLFIKDDRRFCKICFQHGLIVYQTPLFHQIFILNF